MICLGSESLQTAAWEPELRSSDQQSTCGSAAPHRLSRCAGNLSIHPRKNTGCRVSRSSSIGLSSADREIECHLLSEGRSQEEAFDETTELGLKGEVDVIQSVERFRRSRSILGRGSSMSEGTEAVQSMGSREQQAACVGQGGGHGNRGWTHRQWSDCERVCVTLTDEDFTL